MMKKHQIQVSCVPPTKRGFTLVELSIVLVILGLLVGGVLAGQALISAARTRAGITQLSELRASVYQFRDKYQCMPGDCTNMTAFFNAAAQPERVTNGNGNGVIDVVNALNLNAWQSSEIFPSMDHLAAAGMINLKQFDESNLAAASTTWDTGVGYLESKFEAKGSARVTVPALASLRTSARPGILLGYQTRVGYIPERHVMMVGACRYLQWAGTFLAGECGINPPEAYQLDVKVDDGVPSNGTVINVPVNFYMTPSNGFSWVSLCSTMTFDNVTGVATSPGAYNVQTENNRGCLMEVAL